MDRRRSGEENRRYRRQSPQSGRETGSGDVGTAGKLRGQSSVISVVLLIGLTVTGATAVYLVGASALSESKEEATLQSAENGLSRVDNKAARVAVGTNNTERIRLDDASGGQTRVEPEAGQINVTLENDSSGAVREVLLNGSLGRIVHEVNGAQVAF